MNNGNYIEIISNAQNTFYLHGPTFWYTGIKKLQFYRTPSSSDYTSRVYSPTVVVFVHYANTFEKTNTKLSVQYLK